MRISCGYSRTEAQLNCSTAGVYQELLENILQSWCTKHNDCTKGKVDGIKFPHYWTGSGDRKQAPSLHRCRQEKLRPEHGAAMRGIPGDGRGVAESRR